MNSKKLKGAERRTTWTCKGILLIFCLFTLFPILFVLNTSLKETSEFYENVWGIPKEFAWGNYYYAWDTAQIGTYFFNSLLVVGITVLVTIVISALAGYALAKLGIKRAGLIVMLIFLCTMLPSESILMPTYLMTARLGMIGTYLSLIIPYIGWGSAFATYIYYNFFLTVPTEIIEAARIDGCGEVKIFGKIVFPMILPATATVAIFTFLSWWGELLWSSVDLAASELKTLPLGVLAFVQSAGTDWGPLCAASCIIIIPLIIFFLFFQKYFIAGLTGGSVKG